MTRPLSFTQVQNLLKTLNDRVTIAVNKCNKEIVKRGFTLRFTFTQIDIDNGKITATARFDYHRYYKTYQDASNTSIDDETYIGVSYTIVFKDIFSMWVFSEDIKFDIVFNGSEYPLAYHLLTGKSDIVATGMVQSDPLCQFVLLPQAIFLADGKCL